MTETEIIQALQSAYLPIAPTPVSLDKETGLVLVDLVKGFAEVGKGPLAPPTPNQQVSQMVAETDQLAKRFLATNLPVLAFLDTHRPGKAEPPYPPHCEIGTGEEDFVDELAWLESESGVTLVRKDCINGFIGAIQADGTNTFVDWVHQHKLKRIITLGICTDICVMDFVLTALSARNHGLLGKFEGVIVYTEACATYDLPEAAAHSLGLPKTAIHPQSLAHHIGLYCMASRGAILASEIT